MLLFLCDSVVSNAAYKFSKTRNPGAREGKTSRFHPPFSIHLFRPATGQIVPATDHRLLFTAPRPLRQTASRPLPTARRSAKARAFIGPLWMKISASKASSPAAARPRVTPRFRAGSRRGTVRRQIPRPRDAFNAARIDLAFYEVRTEVFTLMISMYCARRSSLRKEFRISSIEGPRAFTCSASTRSAVFPVMPQ